jgi:hypothetical protein
MTATEPEFMSARYRLAPSGGTATEYGSAPAFTLAKTRPDAALTAQTVPAPGLVT